MLLAVVVLCITRVGAQGNARSLPPGSSGTLQRVHVNRQTVRIPFTQGDDIRFSELSTEAGLSQTRVAQIVQDDRGFMWFGTQYGLNRYDGYESKVFLPDPSQRNSLGGAYIYSLFEDHSGMIWVGCGQYLDRLDPTTESFTHYRLAPRAVTVTQISQDHSGLLWLATTNGLYALDSRTGRVVQHYLHNALDPLSLSSDSVTSVAEDRSGGLWVADGSGTVERVDRKTGTVTLRGTFPSSAPEFWFYEDSAGTLWLYNSAGTFASLAPDSRELTYYSFLDKTSRKISEMDVSSVLQDKNGVLWLGTTGEGLLKFDPEHRNAICYRHGTGRVGSLADDRVIALTQDSAGNIWVGLHASEPDVFSTRKPLFRPLLSDRIKPNRLGEHLINFIYEDREGDLWVSTPGALFGIDQKTGKYRSYAPPGGLNDDIVAMTQDRSGAMWVGTTGRGLNRFDPSTGRFTPYLHNPAVPSSLSNDAVDHLFVDHKGTIWVGTWDGLNRFDPQTGGFVVYRDSQNRTDPVYGIAEDRSGTLWLGGTSGLQHFDPATGTFTEYQHELDDPNSISDDRVISVYVDLSGAVWAATHNGLNRLNPQTGIFTRYYMKDGLPSDRLNCILPDRFGHLWISTTEGLSEFDPLEKTFTNFSVADGLPGMDLTGWSACAESPTGEMYFGGFSGGISFFPDEIVKSTYVPAIVLTDFQLAGRSVGAGRGSPLKRSISYSRSVTLSHSQTTFGIEFAALSFISEATNRYRYKLEGLDSNWHEVGSRQRLVNYNMLSAGEYEFRVEGATSHGAWSDPGASLQIQMLPPWWGTLWFRSLCVIFILLCVWAGHSYRMRQITHQFEVRFEERVSERTRIARELHDTLLQSVQGLVFRLQAVGDLMPEGKAKDQLEQSLQRVDQAIGEGRSTVYDLRSSATATNDLVQAVNALGSELTTENSAEFRVVVEGAVRDLHPIVRDEVYRITREALRNAFNHARASQIETEITYGERLFRLRIRDDGKGIPNDILEDGRPGHYGLPGMRERAEHIGGKFEIWSGAKAGTEIELSIAGSVAYGTSTGRSLFRFFRHIAG